MSDIVNQLRDWAATICTVRGTAPEGSKTKLARAAADEIERLREELTASHESHGNEVGALTERLSLAIHERDEARRALAAWQANLSEPQEVDPADLQALIDATWKDDRLTVRMSARDLWRMASDHRGRNEP